MHAHRRGSLYVHALIGSKLKRVSQSISAFEVSDQV